ncbi:MAG: PaaI family thioesterase [Polyangia bacterium]
MTEDEIHHLGADRIPLVRRLGITVIEILTSGAIGARLHLPLDPESLNHTGGLHAGAMFTAAETAALLSCFAALGRTEATCHTKTCELRFRKPARSELWASAQLREETLLGLGERLTAEGKVDVPVLVELTDAAGERIAEGTITVSVRRI